MSMFETGQAGRWRQPAWSPRAATTTRSFALLGAVVLSSAGCALGEVIVRESQPPEVTSGTPAAAALYVTGDPEVAERGTTVRMTAHGGSDEVVVLEVKPGERIIAQAAAMPGDYVVTDSEGECSAPVSLAEGRETDVVLTMPPDQPCQITIAGDHVAGELPHPWFGAASITLAGPAIPSATLAIRSLDSPPNPAPSGGLAEPDRGDHFYVTGLPQGRYEATITSDGVKIGSATFQIGAGAQAEVSVLVQTQATP
jgi:hypothetical protein